MGCGCGKKGPNRRDRIKQQIRNQRQQVSSLLSTTPLSSKSFICMSCPESKQNAQERKKGVRVCRKSNRLINNVIRDPRFVCP